MMNYWQQIKHRLDAFYDLSAFAEDEITSAFSRHTFLSVSSPVGPWQRTFRVSWIGHQAWIGLEVGRQPAYLGLEDIACLKYWHARIPQPAAVWLVTNHTLLEPAAMLLPSITGEVTLITVQDRKEIAPALQNIVGKISSQAEAVQHDRFFASLQSILNVSGLGARAQDLCQIWREIPLTEYLGRKFVSAQMPAGFSITTHEEELFEKMISLLGRLVSRSWSENISEESLLLWVTGESKKMGLSAEFNNTLLLEARQLAQEISIARASYEPG